MWMEIKQRVEDQFACPCHPFKTHWNWSQMVSSQISNQVQQSCLTPKNGKRKERHQLHVPQVSVMRCWLARDRDCWFELFCVFSVFFLRVFFMLFFFFALVFVCFPSSFALFMDGIFFKYCFRFFLFTMSLLMLRHISTIQAVQLQLNMCATHSCKLSFFGLLTLQGAANAAEVHLIFSLNTMINSMPGPLASQLIMVTIVWTVFTSWQTCLQHGPRKKMQNKTHQKKPLQKTPNNSNCRHILCGSDNLIKSDKLWWCGKPSLPHPQKDSWRL